MTLRLVDANNDPLDDTFEEYSDALQFIELMGWEILKEGRTRIKVRTGDESASDEDDDWREVNGSDDL